jgi:large subunit ribosomal protein L28
MEEIMSRQCEICGKKRQVGNNVSHAHNRNKREFRPNLFKVRALVEGSPKRVRVCSRCIRSGKIVKP